VPTYSQTRISVHTIAGQTLQVGGPSPDTMSSGRQQPGAGGAGASAANNSSADLEIDYYEILGVERSAGPDEIRKSYVDVRMVTLSEGHSMLSRAAFD